MDAYAARLNKEQRRAAWLAYHIEALARHKRLPDIERLMGEPPRAQTEEEMLAHLERFVHMHNAKLAKAQERVDGSR